jgi:hypothetical protein
MTQSCRIPRLKPLGDKVTFSMWSPFPDLGGIIARQFDSRVGMQNMGSGWLER